jgi:acetylornithine deacetylase
VHAAIARYVSELNADIESLPTRGPVNRYVLPDGSRGRVELTIGGSIDGVAVNMANDGFQALSAATKEVLGKCEHYSITGSLPLIDTLQSEGFDVNIAGFGKSDAYHADNEYALMADLKNGTKILTKFIEILEDK